MCELHLTWGQGGAKILMGKFRDRLDIAKEGIHELKDSLGRNYDSANKQGLF